MIDPFDLVNKIQSTIKKAPYGKLDLSLINQNGNTIEASMEITNKILIRKNQNALIALSGEVVKILEEQTNGKFTVEFCFKNKEVYKLIIKHNQEI